MTWTTRGLRGIALVAALGLLAACSGGGGEGEPSSGGTSQGGDGGVEPASTITLTSGFASNGGGQPQWLEETIASFKEKTGITVEVEEVPWADIVHVIESAAVAGDTTDLYTQNFVSEFWPYYDEGVLADTGQFLKDWGISDLLEPDALDQWTTPDGVVGGIPYLSFYWPMWWNTDLLEQAGIDAPPVTTDELIEDAAKLRAAGIQPVAIDGNDWGGVGFTWLMSQLYTGHDVEADLMANGGFADNPDAVKGFDLVGQLRDAGVFIDNAAGYSNAETVTAFIEGKAAAGFFGSWAYDQVVDAGMDPAKIALTGFPLPEGSAYDKPVALRGGNNGFFMSQKAADDPAKVEAIKLFVQHLFSPEVLQAWVGTYSQFSPATQEAVGGAKSDKALNNYTSNELPNLVDFAALHDLYVKSGVFPIPEVAWFLGTPGATGQEMAEKYDALYQE
jgi:multiple sugar transport system substrate-binding protein